MGEILKVKPLAALAMLDEGELDWKIVAISLDDPRASLVNDVDDVERHFPVSQLSTHPPVPTTITSIFVGDIEEFCTFNFVDIVLNDYRYMHLGPN